MTKLPQEDAPFTLRRDAHGIRVVFQFGNEAGDCRYHCRFCTSRNTPRVTPQENMNEFDRQLAAWRALPRGRRHPVIYNEGNCTDEEMFSRQTLRHVLAAFQNDANVAFLSINSRENEATDELLQDLVAMRLTYPVHFILGVESFSKELPQVLGKDTTGEMERFVRKLKGHNDAYCQGFSRTPAYRFGLDVNLVFLPDLYLGLGQSRRGSEAAIMSGIKSDVRGVLDRLDPSVPTEINIHPYTRTPTIECDDAELGLLMEVLPELQKMIEEHRRTWSGRPTHMFIGIEGKGYGSAAWARSITRWISTIDAFNATGQVTLHGDRSRGRR